MNELAGAYDGGSRRLDRCRVRRSAYNSASNEYLVVWVGDTDEGDLVEGELEIWGQRLDAVTGALVGPRIRISDAGPDGNTSFRPSRPDVVYNPSAGEFLVVWSSTDEPAGSGKEEIWGQRLVGGTGAEVGSHGFRISNQGSSSASNLDGSAPEDLWHSMK